MKLFSNHEKNKNKKIARLPLSAYLSYLFIATLLFTGVSFSKYATTVSGTDNARVAFVVADASMEKISADNEIDAAAGEAFQVKVTVSNMDASGKPSEIALDYVVYIDVPAEPKLIFSVSDMVEDEKASTDTCKVFKSTTPLPAGEGKTVEHIVSIKGDASVVGVHNNLNYKIRAKVEQAD